jgi:hypothetical protein
MIPRDREGKGVGLLKGKLSQNGAIPNDVTFNPRKKSVDVEKTSLFCTVVSNLSSEY